MSAYLIANYKITNPEAYEKYPPAVIGTLAAHDVEVVVADYESDAVEGEPGHVTIVLKFASKEAIKAWYDSSEYQEIIRFRTDNSEGSAVFAEGFVPPQ
jgi:uncharacterized protein (DUF1330 family)